MKKQKQMQKAFGVNEFGLIVFLLGSQMFQFSRIVYGNERGCSRYFPHGWETNYLGFSLF